MITIRKTELTDIDAALAVYALAKQYMRRCGNLHQWAGEYPGRADIARDIAAGNSYVGIDADGRVRFVFAFILGEDSTYNHIEGGHWLNDAPYGTIHRIASRGEVPGLGSWCINWCLELCGSIRIDTHERNLPMRRTLEKLGFTYCGTILCDDGTPRRAYQKDL